MNVQERIRQAIDQHQDRLRASVPPDTRGAIVALIRAQDRLPPGVGGELVPDLITGRRLANLGGSKAFQLCLEAAGADSVGSPVAGNDDLDRWSVQLLHECERLAEAEVVLAHCESGFMQAADDGHGTFDAWIATRRAPTRWRERADVDWWAASLATRHQPELRAAKTERSASDHDGLADEAHYRRVAGAHLKTMAYQLGYPPAASIDGCTVQTCLDVLCSLIGWALQARDRGELAAPRSEAGVIAALASELAADPAAIGRAVAGLTLDRESAEYHAAVPGVAAAPLVRVAEDQLVLSIHGLTSEPLLFLTRELRRRAAQAYHNSAHLREAVFRQDLYALFQDRRFVTSTGRIELRRDSGDVRTDVDAVVYDRKSGTLGLFELKSQDPFARSTAELIRQRDNVLHANRQISGVLTWVQRQGADALLARVDARTARTFRAQKVYPFVLGRYLAHFDDGPEPDRRAAWGTWPELLRLLDSQPVRASDANPLASLWTRLTRDAPPIGPPVDAPSREIAIGAVRLVVHPSFAAFRSKPTAGPD